MEGRRSGTLGEVVGMRSDCRRESRTSACTSAAIRGGPSDADLRRLLSSTAASSSSAAARLFGPNVSLAALCIATRAQCHTHQAYH